jgi:hypothetical protein
VLEDSLAPTAIKLASATAQPGISFEIGAAAEAALRWLPNNLNQRPIIVDEEDILNSGGL